MKPLVIFLVLMNSLAGGVILSNTVNGGSNNEFFHKLQTALAAVKIETACPTPSTFKTASVSTHTPTQAQAPLPAPQRTYQEPETAPLASHHKEGLKQLVKGDRYEPRYDYRYDPPRENRNFRPKEDDEENTTIKEKQYPRRR
jgi:hypothetical protein